MSDIATGAVPPRRKASSTGDAIFAAFANASGIFVLILLGAIIVSLFVGGLQAFTKFGIPFVWTADWDPVQEVFGAGVPVYGTVVTAVLALAVVAPARAVLHEALVLTTRSRRSIGRNMSRSRILA